MSSSPPALQFQKVSLSKKADALFLYHTPILFLLSRGTMQSSLEKFVQEALSLFDKILDLPLQIILGISS